MNNGKRYVLLLSTVGLLAAWALTIETHFIRPPVPIDPRRAAELSRQAAASWQDVSIAAPDRVRLRGWLFTPIGDSGRGAVLLVHGGRLDRQQMLTRAHWLLKAGYACLLIDQRGCGASGGLISYGVHEPADIAAWAAWLRKRTGATRVFGYGSSRGSTTLIQSLAARPPLNGIAAEGAGTGNIARPYEIAADRLGVSEAAARLISWPLIEPSFAWVSLRHGLNLRMAQSGIEAVRHSRVPLLIVQGTADDVTPLRGAERLRAANPRHVELLAIPGVGHDWFPSDRNGVVNRILAWFQQQADRID